MSAFVHDGGLYTYGNNQSGLLGHSVDMSYVSEPLRVESSKESELGLSESRVTQVAIGEYLLMTTLFTILIRNQALTFRVQLLLR